MYESTTDSKQKAGEGVGLPLERGIFENLLRFVGIIQSAPAAKKKMSTVIDFQAISNDK